MQLSGQQVVFFNKGDDISKLNHAMLYVRDNEHTNRIKFVTVVGEKQEPPERLAAVVGELVGDEELLRTMGEAARTSDAAGARERIASACEAWVV